MSSAIFGATPLAGPGISFFAEAGHQPSFAESFFAALADLVPSAVRSGAELIGISPQPHVAYPLVQATAPPPEPQVSPPAPESHVAPPPVQTIAPVTQVSAAQPKLQVENQRLLELINGARRQHGLRPVAFDDSLALSAVAHSKRMAAAGRLAHDGVGDGSATSRLARLGAHATENIGVGAGSADEVFAMWMDSPDHRRNILDPEARRHGGATAVSASGQVYWTQVFTA